MTALRQKLDDPRNFVRDFVLLMLGLAAFALAMVLSLQSNLGANSWTVFHEGISLHTPLTLGTAGIMVGLIILVISWLLGIAPGFGTLLNMLLIGIWIDVFLHFGLVPEAHALPLQIAMLIVSIVLLGFATALYIKTDFGAGPRDAFMLALTRATGIRVGFIRWGIESTVVMIGILLGGSFGIGTILFALTIGPSVDFFFNLFNISTQRTHSPQIVSESSGD